MKALNGVEEIDSGSFICNTRYLECMGILVYCKPFIQPYFNVFAGGRLLQAMVSLEMLSLP